MAEVEEPWYRSFIQNIKETFNPPKLPPLELTSKPVAVKDIWGLYGRQKKSFMMSTGFQIGRRGCSSRCLFDQAGQEKVKQVVPLFTPVDIDAFQPKMAPKKQAMGGGGGGGDRSPLPASKGRLPKQSLRQFTPPMAVVNNPNPKLTMEPSIIVPPDVNLPNVNMAQYGDPLGKLGPPSNGPGSGGGIGSGSGGGVGSGKGGGFGPGEGGGVGGGVYRVGGGVTAPVVLFKKEPEYSEEARKAKYQGTVLLYIEVDPSGKATNIQRGPQPGTRPGRKGHRSREDSGNSSPAIKDGKPVTVAATIEVNFRLL